MRERYIPALIMLIAGAITSVINIVNKVERVDGLKRLLLVIVLFYFVGVIAKVIIVKALTKEPKPFVDEEETNEEEKQPEEK